MSEETQAREAEVRKQLRRSQSANTLTILFFVFALIGVAGYFIVTSDLWQRTEPVEAELVEDAPRPAPAITSEPAPAEVAVSATTNVPVIAEITSPKPAMRPDAPTPRTSEGERPAPKPAIRYSPPEPSVATEAAPADPAASASASADPAKRMLVSIKCFDDFAFERQVGIRKYYSARCASGLRRQVSCVGAGCKIEYAPAPSHVPSGG